jgi:hypothetical protein
MLASGVRFDTLARKRESGVTLPEGVEKTKVRKRNGKVYTY